MRSQFLRQKLGIDFFGTLNKNQPIIKKFMESLMASGVEIIIISGATQEILSPLLARENIEKGKHFKDVLSIPEFLISKNFKIVIRPDRSYFTCGDVWWGSKAYICAENHITTHIDSDMRYKKGFYTCSTRFIHNDYRLINLITQYLDTDGKEDVAVLQPGVHALGGVFPC